MALEKELNTYKEEFPKLLAHEGKFVLIHDKELSIWATYEDALQAGYRSFELKPFLVKQIQSVERVQYLTSSVNPVCQS
jgi:hypothetical protein